MTTLLSVPVDEITYCLLLRLAEEQGLDVAELSAQLLYRDAASASGWPGKTGEAMRTVLRLARADRME